jgi:hypothetical protein
MSLPDDLLPFDEASRWASARLGRDVTAANIAYLVNYGRVEKYPRADGTACVSQAELAAYYDTRARRPEAWRARLGDDLNWALAFEHVKESETTKHVHRLHPYKGKFIPQLVEYFLDSHTDAFKPRAFFAPGDIVLDPFCGSGTTLVQAAELGLHAIGVDISQFNALISNVKVGQHDLAAIRRASEALSAQLQARYAASSLRGLEAELDRRLAAFNREHFPSPEFKIRARRGELDADRYGAERAAAFLPVYETLLRAQRLEIAPRGGESFLDSWTLAPIRAEIELLQAGVEAVAESDTRDVLRVILSRAVRSCRATTHSDLATLKTPVTAPYYCVKHGKLCRPLLSLRGWWARYAADSLERLETFDRLRGGARQICLAGDSRNIDLSALLDKQKIRGIFSSPPYVGLIDYHEQHAYAYELFRFARRDESEIGPLFRGSGQAAQASYVEGIAAVLRNTARFLAEDFDIFLVANDKFDLYPRIAARAGMQIVNRYKRPVLNRTERDKAAYAEVIFHIKRGKSSC